MSPTPLICGADTKASVTTFKHTRNIHTRARSLQADDPEKQLIQRLCRGDAEAQSELLARYYEDVVTVVARMLGNRGDVEEVVQTVFMRVFSNLARYRGQVPLSIWILRHVVGVVRLQRRARRSRSANGAGDACIAVSDEPHDFQSQSPYSEALDHLMGQLNEELRTAFVLHEILGIHTNDIASILQTPAVVLKARLYLAKRKLVDSIASEPRLNSRLLALLNQSDALPLPAVGMSVSSTIQVPIHERPSQLEVIDSVVASTCDTPLSFMTIQRQKPELCAQPAIPGAPGAPDVPEPDLPQEPVPPDDIPSPIDRHPYPKYTDDPPPSPVD